MVVSAKAFASITVLLFLLFFLFITIDVKKEDLTDFIIISQVETRKENTYLNFEMVLKKSLDDCKDDPLKVKESVILESFKFIKNEANFFINDSLLNKNKPIDILSYSEMVKIIVYKPHKTIIVKEVHITNGLFNNKTLGFKINNKRYESSFFFPKKYFLRKVVFCQPI
jgi:hypothetical protein